MNKTDRIIGILIALLFVIALVFSITAADKEHPCTLHDRPNEYSQQLAAADWHIEK